MKKYRELAHNADLTRMQEEYLRTIIRYVCQNGDIRKEILVNQQPFNSINVAGLFGDKATLAGAIRKSNTSSYRRLGYHTWKSTIHV